MNIRTSLRQGVATLEINRPEKKNALTIEMYQTMCDALFAAQADPAVRVVLITGQPGMFTSGNDLEDFVQRPPTSMNSPVFVFMQTLTRFDKPIVAAVEGPAVGLGATLLLHCDLVYVAEDATLSVPFVKLGLVPEFASSVLLPLNAGHVKASEKLLLGEPFSAREALEMGMVNAILPAEQVQAHAWAIAEKLSQLPPGAVRDTKRLLRHTYSKQLLDAIQIESRIFCSRLNGAEAKEAMTAFLEKRTPDFSGC